MPVKGSTLVLKPRAQKSKTVQTFQTGLISLIAWFEVYTNLFVRTPTLIWPLQQYFSLFADEDECESASAVCQNNGTCQDGVGTFTCACVPGYRGPTCECKYLTITFGRLHASVKNVLWPILHMLAIFRLATELISKYKVKVHGMLFLPNRRIPNILEIDIFLPVVKICHTDVTNFCFECEYKFLNQWPRNTMSINL